MGGQRGECSCWPWPLAAFWAAAMRRKFWCDEEEVRESPEHLIFAGRGREVLLEVVLCRGPYISVPGTPAIGGRWEWRGRWSDLGPILREGVSQSPGLA